MESERVVWDECDALNVNSDLPLGKISRIKSHEANRELKESETRINFTDIFILFRIKEIKTIKMSFYTIKFGELKCVENSMCKNK